MKLYLTDPSSHKAFDEISNLGDLIIKEAVTDNLPPDVRKKVNGWVPIDFHKEKVTLSRDDLLILAGANIVSNTPFLNPAVWRPNLWNALKSNYVILFGIGWWQYQEPPQMLTRRFYQRCLIEPPVVHSVRDAYTQTMFKKCGIDNTINTGCPSMWNLPDTLSFGTQKPDQVVFTLTDYNRDIVNDECLISILLENYRTAIFFPQGADDISYLRSFASDSQFQSIRILERSVDAFDSILKSDGIDYVGTRLHAGIRALQLGRRSFVIAVDNRAVEISKDTNLPIVERSSLSMLKDHIHGNFSFRFRINRKGIDEFRRELSNYLS